MNKHILLSLTVLIFFSFCIYSKAESSISLDQADFSTLRIFVGVSESSEFTANKMSSSDLGNGSFSWSGNLESGSSGFLSFVRKNNFYSGYIFQNGNSFISFSGESGKIEFTAEKKKPKPCGGCILAGSLPPDPRGRAPSLMSGHNGDANLIDLLVVYPHVVKDEAGSALAVEAVVEGAIADTNLCFRNSLVPAQVRLVHIEELSYTPTGTMGVDLDKLEGTADGDMDNVHALRDTHGADLVCLLVSNSDSGGIAKTMSYPSLSFASSGFNVSDWNQLGAPSYTLTHEIGHNMGCLHNREDTSGDLSEYNFQQFSYGKRWVSGGQGFGTIMSYDTKPTSTYPITIPYFSNPSVDFLSTPTGNTNSEDNAQVLAFTAPYVSNFRNSVVQSILPTAFSYRVAEGNSTSFSVRLTVQPTSPVRVNLSMSGDSDLFVSSSPTLDFNSSNWNLPHPVQISCQSDSDTSDGSATLSLTATGITTRSIQISEIDQGSASVSNLLVTGSVVNALGIGESNIFLTFSNGGGTVKTDEDGTFRNLVTSGWSGNITPALTDYSFTPSSLSVNSLSNNSLGNSFVSHRSNILYVDKDAMGRGDGSSWQNAYTELSVALVSKHSFTQVWVAEGVYLPGATRAASFTLPLNKSVYGGFASGESSFSERNVSANPTVLSGDIGVSNNGTDNSFHVVVPSQNSVLDGFTIRDGNATYNFSNDDRGIGGGLYAKNSSFVISNCIFTSNQSYQRGGAVFIEDVNTTFRNCTFSNHVSTKGGAIDINNSQISFISCDFINNSSELQGGAIYWRESNGSIMDSNFTSNVNVTSNGGGGIYIENSSPSVTNCNFSFNVTHANNYGGAVKLAGSSPSFTNCSFVRNESKVNSGGAIYIDSSSVPTFSGNEFQFNSAASFGGAIFTEGSNLDMNNSLFLGNYADLGGGVATKGSVAISFTNTMALVNEANSSVSSSAGFIYLNTGVTSSLFVNCVFSGNRSFGRNGVYRPHGMSRFVNCTFSGNQAVAEGGITIMFSGDSIDVSNCILWGNSGGTVNDIYVNVGTATANNSLFNPNQSNGTISGSNNINSDPLFTDFNGPDNILGNLDDDLTLQSTSPAIDIGSNSLTNYVNTDLNGRNRGGVPDLGAYEYSGNSAPSFTSISSLSIPENQMAVVDVNASDSDGNSLIYSITGGSDQSKFQIDSLSGVLTFLNAPDYENPTDSDGDGEYRVIVSVSDSVDTVTQEIVVSVSDSVDALETFTVSGGQSSSPYFTLIDSSGGVVDFSTYALQRGATYFFVASNISSSHPFMIGESNGDLSSSLVSDGPLTSSSNGQKITVTIPSDFSGPLYYFCTVHSGMNFSFQISKQAPVIAESSGSISLSLSEDGALSYDINASDPDGNSLLWSITSSASNGAANINSNTGVLSYTPTANYHGSDSVTVQVSDGSHTDSLIVALTVSSVNDAPIISGQDQSISLSLSQNASLNYDINATDLDGDSLAWTLTKQAKNGIAWISSDTGVFSYNPKADFNGSDSVSLQVSDGLAVDTFTINITIHSVESVIFLTDGIEQPSLLGWKRAGWFGYFFSDFYPWVFHENLGWIYVSQNDLQDAWFHHKQLGWIWTKPEEFPALYRDSDYTDDVKGSWIYLDRTVGPTRYYDYAQEQWLVID